MTPTLRPLFIAIDPQDTNHCALLVDPGPLDLISCPCGTPMKLVPGEFRTTEYSSRGTCRADSRFRVDPPSFGETAR